MSLVQSGLNNEQVPLMRTIYIENTFYLKQVVLNVKVAINWSGPNCGSLLYIIINAS